MNKLLLTLTLITIGVSSIFANLGDTSAQNQFRWSTEPIKMITIDNTPLLTHIVVYNEHGALYIETISADTVVMETVIANQNSTESPESIVNRFQGLYSEGEGWEDPTEEKNDQGAHHTRFVSRGEHLYGMYIYSWDNVKTKRIDCYVQLGAKHIKNAMYQIDKLMTSGELKGSLRD